MVETTTQYGWKLIESAPLELDIALSLACRGVPSAFVQPHTQLLVERAAAWSDVWIRMIGPQKSWFALCEPLAALAGVLDEPDYQRASRSMRDLTIETALEQATLSAQARGLEQTEESDQVERLALLCTQLHIATFHDLGFSQELRADVLQQYTNELRRAIRFLDGGDMHEQGWHLLDTFYHKIYAPWRAQRGDVLAHANEQAIAALGGASGAQPPALDWLPAQNPLHNIPELNAVAHTGARQIAFLIEPFGLFDAAYIFDNIIIVACSEPSQLYHDALNYTADLAQRLQALADPTRLIMLRMIRSIGVSNTSIAQYLEIARPTVSIHAKILREAGLITTTPDGRAVQHEIDPAAVRRLFRELEHFLDLPEE